MDMIDEDDGFEEILEIFVEEVSEVVDIIDSNLQHLENDPAADKPLKELRRAFHTLKGSSRMVNANAIGDVGWVMEDLLNRIVDGDVDVHKDIVGLTIDVRDAIPRLLSAFKKRQAAAMSGVNIPSFAERANAIIAGETAEVINPVLMDISNNMDASVNSDATSSLVVSSSVKADIEGLIATTGDLSEELNTLKAHAKKVTENIESFKLKINSLSSDDSSSVEFKNKFSQIDKSTQDVADMQYLIKSTYEQITSDSQTHQQRLSEAIRIVDESMSVKLNDQLHMIQSLKKIIKVGFALGFVGFSLMLAGFFTLL